MPGPETFNDDRIDALSRETYYRAISLAKGLLDNNAEGFNPDRVTALAQLADAAACGFKDAEASETF